MEWISVEDRLPDESGIYLTSWTDGAIETYEFSSPKTKGWDAPLTNHLVTHWMPLPEPPKESE